MAIVKTEQWLWGLASRSSAALRVGEVIKVRNARFTVRPDGVVSAYNYAPNPSNLICYVPTRYSGDTFNTVPQEHRTESGRNGWKGVVDTIIGRSVFFEHQQESQTSLRTIATTWMRSTSRLAS
jgi:hypothetical protein